MTTMTEMALKTLLDPSRLYRPEVGENFTFVNEEALIPTKDKLEFRKFNCDENDGTLDKVKETYLKMHTNQTVDFVKNRTAHWTRFDKVKLNILDALDKLNDLVDESDPDVSLPNIGHAYQTAEAIRAIYPDHDWFQLTGLIHDLGKVMVMYGEEQWATVGDTFPVGCAHADSIVYADTTFHNNPDTKNPAYNTKYGMYWENCGLDNVRMSWGHDEYLYRVLLNHGHNLPVEALYMIRYHSFYPWHSAGAYSYLCNNNDTEALRWVREFNKFDLYTKENETPDMEALRPYYQSLVDKYIPGVISW